MNEPVDHLAIRQAQFFVCMQECWAVSDSTGHCISALWHARVDQLIQ